MPWWGWMIVGALLLGAELLGVDAGFYLVFIGTAAAITGLVELTGVGLEPWMQWILFSCVALVMMVFFRKKLYAHLRGGGVGYKSGPTGDIVTLDQGLEPHEKGRLFFRGTDWNVVNESGETFDKGQRVQISGVDGLTLKLDKIKQQD